MHPRRLVRINELICQTVSKVVLNLKDPDVGFVTITGSEVSPDISIVRIFYSVLGTEEEKQRTAQVLERAIPLFKRELGKLENLKKVPSLVFLFDESVEKASRVHQILNSLQKENKTDG